MINISVARRYARALLEVTSEADSADALVKQLGEFAALVGKNPDLVDVFVNPAFSRAQRDAIANEIFKRMGEVQHILANLIHLLIERQRMADLPNIARLFRDMVDAKAGRIRGRLTTAVPLAEESVQRLEHTLERMTQRSVILEKHVDPSVLGGASAQVGSVVYDGTLRNELNQIRRGLKRT